MKFPRIFMIRVTKLDKRLQVKPTLKIALIGPRKNLIPMSRLTLTIYYLPLLSKSIH